MIFIVFLFLLCACRHSEKHREFNCEQDDIVAAAKEMPSNKLTNNCKLLQGCKNSKQGAMTRCLAYILIVYGLRLLKAGT